jgi:hypothetical protein
VDAAIFARRLAMGDRSEVAAEAIARTTMAATRAVRLGVTSPFSWKPVESRKISWMWASR